MSFSPELFIYCSRHWGNGTAVPLHQNYKKHKQRKFWICEYKIWNFNETHRPKRGHYWRYTQMEKEQNHKRFKRHTFTWSHVVFCLIRSTNQPERWISFCVCTDSSPWGTPGLMFNPCVILWERISVLLCLWTWGMKCWNKIKPHCSISSTKDTTCMIFVRVTNINITFTAECPSRSRPEFEKLHKQRLQQT